MAAAVRGETKTTTTCPVLAGPCRTMGVGLTTSPVETDRHRWLRDQSRSRLQGKARVMLKNLSAEIRECYEHAEKRGAQGRSSNRSKAKSQLYGFAAALAVPGAKRRIHQNGWSTFRAKRSGTPRHCLRRTDGADADDARRPPAFVVTADAWTDANGCHYMNRILLLDRLGQAE